MQSAGGYFVGTFAFNPSDPVEDDVYLLLRGTTVRIRLIVGGWHDEEESLPSGLTS